MKEFEVFSAEDFRKWLEKNHDKEEKVALIIHKKHTGKSFPTHKEVMFEAICFGWIDTTIKRIDEDRYIRHFSRRNKNSKWSDNTLSYAKQLKKEGKMTERGLHFYKEGLKKPTHDAGIPKNPNMPKELAAALKKNKTARKFFEKLSPSKKRPIYRWYLSAKQEATKKKRLEKILELAKKEKTVF
ncbi:MAG: YdeI/OmpD-associated family protein [Candidatus Paceibacterota bacterium]